MNKRHPFYQEDLQNILLIKGIEQIRNKNFLITGASGLIGTCLIDSLMLYNERGANIHIYAVGRNKQKVFSRLGEYYSNNHFHFIEQDVRSPFSSDLKVDYIIPLASNTHPTAYSLYPIETIEINVKGAEHALNKAIECGATVLYPSTVEVYGNAKGEETFEENSTGKLNLSTSRACYTESKRLCEAYCQSFISEKGAIVKVARLSRIFGPTMLETDTKASSQFIMKAIQGEDIILKSKGEQLFSYTYVADAVSALLYILIHGENGQAYNVSVDSCNVRLKDFASLCANWAKKEVIYHLPSDIEKKGFSIAMRAIMDNAKLKSIGWSSSLGIKEAINRTLEILSYR